MKKYNFVKILMSVCSGVKIFPEIVKNSVIRTLWHLLLLSLLCSIGFVAARTPELQNNIKQVTAFLQKEFGNVLVKKNGVYPTNAPDKQKNITYDFVQIDYYPKMPTEKEFKINDKLDNMGFIWLPTGITGWIKVDTSRYIIYQGMASENTPQWFTVTNKAGIYAYVKRNQMDSFKQVYACLCAPLPGDVPLFMLLSPLQQMNSFADFQGNVYWYSSVMAGIKFVIMIFFNALFYSLLFGLFFSISGRRSSGKKDFSFKNSF